MNITDAQADWVDEVRKTLANQGFRVDADLRNEKIGYKIREHTLQRVPYLLVVGDREKENGAVAVRTRSGEDLGTMSVAEFAARLRDEHVSVSSSLQARSPACGRHDPSRRSQHQHPRKAEPKEPGNPRAARARDRQRWRNGRRAVARRSAGAWPRKKAWTWSRSSRTPIRRSAAIMDFGKFKFEAQKKANAAKKKTEAGRDQGSEVPPGHRRGRLPDQAAQHAPLPGRRRQGQGQHPLPWPRDEPPGAGPRDGQRGSRPTWARTS